MNSVRKPAWQQATALVSLSTCGAMTGFAFAHGSVDEMTSPTRMPVRLMALSKPTQPVSANDSALRSAIVNVANTYLQMAQTKSPAQMEAIIWGRDSLDGVDHGESCAAFASLALELGAQAAGQQSWVSGGTSYPWPLHQWADVRVDPNPDSPNIVSVLQDAQAHGRWHPLGDGYQPQPGDWVLFDGHVEVVTKYAGGVLYTIGGDSGANLSVNAHQYPGALADQGVDGFVDNGELLSAVSHSGGAAGQAAASAVAQGQRSQAQAGTAQAVIPGLQAAALTAVNGGQPAAANGAQRAAAGAGQSGTAGAGRGGTAGAGRGGTAGKDAAGAVGTAGRARGATRAGRPGAANGGATTSIVPMPGTIAGIGTAPPQREPGQTATARRAATAPRAARPRSAAQPRPAARAAAQPRGGMAVIPGLQAITDDLAGGSPAAPAPPAKSPAYTRNNLPAASLHVPGTSAQQAFISQVAPGAMAAQARYGIPASVTIAQAIEESGWGQSALAIRDHNLFGIKGSGPAGTEMLPTQEFMNGSWVTETAPFRVYNNVAESIADHTELLATSAYYQQAMADRHVPDAFANDLTGVYATDPQYGAKLIALMRLYNLYQFDTASATVPQAPAQAQAGVGSQAGAATRPGAAGRAGTVSGNGLAGAGGVFNEGGVVNGGGAAGAGAVPAARPAAASPAGRPAGQAATGRQGGAAIPGYLDAYVRPQVKAPAKAALRAATPTRRTQQAGRGPAPTTAPRGARADSSASRYVPQVPRMVTTAFVTAAKTPLTRAQPLYADVAGRDGIRWQLLAACDWMQCQAQPRYSPVHGEKLGTMNASGTVYRTKSEALAQCASDLVELAMAVYWIDITRRRPLSIRDLAKVFAAFRWGGLLKLHNISAMEFPYSVAGLTPQHMKMRWPDIKEPNAPDKPRTRFRMPFGAVPVVLGLDYPALA